MSFFGEIFFSEALSLAGEDFAPGDFIAGAKERAWNNLNNYDAGFLLQVNRSQEAHSRPTQRLRSIELE